MIAYRPMAPPDRAFVIASWVESFRCAHSAGMIPMSTWRDLMPGIIGEVIDRPDARTLVAYETEEHGNLVDLYGFISGEPDPIWSPVAKQSLPLVFYTYVKAPYRCRGIATGLFRAIGIDPGRAFAFTCKTSWASLLSSKIPHSKWDPLLARFPRSTAERYTPPKVEYRKHGKP